eukprot:SAG31_NODE_1792_length_7256_cov_1.774626_1_plen_539_part_10
MEFLPNGPEGSADAGKPPKPLQPMSYCKPSSFSVALHTTRLTNSYLMQAFSGCTVRRWRSMARSGSSTAGLLVRRRSFSFIAFPFVLLCRSLQSHCSNGERLSLGAHWATMRGTVQGGVVMGATLRRDGWVSVDSAGAGAKLVTKFLTVEEGASTLLVNANTMVDSDLASFGNGSLSLAVLDPETMEPLNGVACKAMENEDSLEHDMGCNGLGGLGGKIVQLEFTLTRCKLYSFMLKTDDASQASPMDNKQVCDITAHGASMGSADNAAAIQAALAECSTGGTVVVSSGRFKSGPLFITGVNVSLQIVDGAALVAAFGPQHWPQITTVDGGPSRSCASMHRPCYQDFVVFRECDGCSLIGSGTLSGRAVDLDWYLLRNVVKNSSRLNASSPNMLTVVDSSDFTLHGVTILDAPKFNVELTRVTRAEISFVNITSPWWTDSTGKVQQPFNTDGIDPGAGSSNVWIHDCYITNGDDSIAVKPSADISSCTRNILVEDCVFERGRGCSIGSIGQGCISDVVFRNITIRSDTGGCRVKTYSTS